MTRCSRLARGAGCEHEGAGASTFSVPLLPADFGSNMPLRASHKLHRGALVSFGVAVAVLALWIGRATIRRHAAYASDSEIAGQDRDEASQQLVVDRQDRIGALCMHLGAVVDRSNGHLTDLDAIAETLDEFLGVYVSADVEQFLALHGSNLEHANSVRAEKAPELARLLVTGFGADESRLPADWTGLTREYWTRLYRQPVVTKIFASTSKITLHHASGDPAMWSEWLAGFDDELNDQFRSSPHNSDHVLAFPHRRDPPEIARQRGELSWFDFSVWLGFASARSSEGEILLRFVWDAIDARWFLCRALTLYEEDESCFLVF